MAKKKIGSCSWGPAPMTSPKPISLMTSLTKKAKSKTFQYFSMQTWKTHIEGLNNYLAQVFPNWGTFTYLKGYIYCTATTI